MHKKVAKEDVSCRGVSCHGAPQTGNNERNKPTLKTFGGLFHASRSRKIFVLFCFGKRPEPWYFWRYDKGTCHQRKQALPWSTKAQSMLTCDHWPYFSEGKGEPDRRFIGRCQTATAVSVHVRTYDRFPKARQVALGFEFLWKWIKMSFPSLHHSCSRWTRGLSVKPIQFLLCAVKLRNKVI